MQKISPSLWFDKEAKEAAELYAAVFPESKILHTRKLGGTPSGEVELVSLQIWGQHFSMMSAGPYFKFTPAISFLVCCDTEEQVNALWEKLIQGGETLMDIGNYSFSQRYGWLKDKFGLSWQIMYMGETSVKQRIIPTLLFVGNVCGRAEEAMNLYTTVFHDATVKDIMRYGAGEDPDKEGTVRHGRFTLEGQHFAAMDSAHKHNFAFNEAISFEVRCTNQEEIDYYWGKLSAVPEAEQCGWLKDTFGVSWQIVPSALDEMMRTDDEEKLARVTQAFLQMKKFDLATLERAAHGG